MKKIQKIIIYFNYHIGWFFVNGNKPMTLIDYEIDYIRMKLKENE